MAKIAFQCHPDIIDSIPHPRPAGKFVPKWYKDKVDFTKCPRTSQNTAPTIKQCLPVRDYITSGYILPAWADIHILKNSDGRFVDNMRCPDDLENRYNMGIEYHNRDQISDTPLEQFSDGHVMVKLSNPWLISTPKGYSTLFVSPFYDASDFTILPAVVDTDKHNILINFPCIVTSDDARLDKGSPLIQAIPFKRDDWSSSVSTFNPEMLYKRNINFMTHIKSLYSKKLWQRKRYR